MKKTIAKLMAAAMMLSTVPAVTLPTFVSNAAPAQAVTNTTTATVANQFFGGVGEIASTSNGEIFAFLLPDGVGADKYEFTAVDGNADVRSFVTLSKVTDNSNPKLIHVRATLDYTKMTSAQKTAYMTAVKNGSNTFKVKMTRNFPDQWAIDSFDSPQAITWMQNLGYNTFEKQEQFIQKCFFSSNVSKTSDKTYRIGGVYDGGKIKSGVADVDGYLMDGNVYAQLDKVLSDGIAEVQLLKQDNNEANKLKNNDNLRGKKLLLNVVWIGGVEYKVGKLGGQALKEAKMKKIELKNCSKVGKGAMRKCKQLKNVNLKDKNKVRKIHAKAFYDCKNLKNISIDARKLNTVGTDSFTKLKKNCRIKLKCSKSKYNSVVKKIKKYNKKANKLKFARIAP
jgi:hypothetical protein